MIRAEFIKPIPNYIAKKIRRLDEKIYGESNVNRFFAYLANMKGQLIKITVACRHYKGQWFCKQVAVHGMHSEYCLVKDMELNYLGGYMVGWFENGLTENIKRYEDGIWYQAQDKYFNPYAIVINRAFALKFKEYKYSAADKLYATDVFEYLHIYEQYPQAEYFIKLGLNHLATKKLLLKKAGKDKLFRKWLIKYAKILRNEHGKFPYFSAQTILNAYKNNIDLLKDTVKDRKLRLLESYGEFKRIIKDVLPENNIDKIIKYLQDNDISISSYADYVEACLNLNVDMTLTKNLYPNDFKRWHDIRIDEYDTVKAVRAEEERKEFYAKFASVAEKYLPLQRDKENTFIVVIAKSPQDLVREGTMLHHCVGRMNYDQRFVREKSLIFFIRKVEDPDTPFVTMEYSLEEKKVLQCHAENNAKPNTNVLKFINKKWLPYANRKLKQIAA